MFFISWRQTEESTTSWQQTPKPPRPGLTESTALSEDTWINQVYFCWQMCWMNMDQLSHKCPSHLSLFLSVCSCCWESSGAVVIHEHPHHTSLSVDWDFCLLVEKWMILVKKNNQSWNEDKLKSKFQSNSTTGSTCRDLRVWTAACHTWENMDVFRKWSMQQHWTSNQTIHAYFMKSSNISCSTVYKPCFCLSLC